jgi:hypothetical protein
MRPLAGKEEYITYNKNIQIAQKIASGDGVKQRMK